MARSRLVMRLALVLGFLAGCGARSALDEPPACDVAADCPPAERFCGPVPSCEGGHCGLAAPRSCADDDLCTDDRCDDASGACVNAPRDRDGDGSVAAECGGDDCDDADPAVGPFARERCTGGRDEDCDGRTDCSDVGDCADDPACAGCSIEVCEGGADEDCDALVDCDDSDCAERCCRPSEIACADDRDDDCDGAVDCVDADCAGTAACCVPRAERCDGLDDDCDGVADDGAPCHVLDGEPIDGIAADVCGAEWYAYGSPDMASAHPSPDVRASGTAVIAIVDGPAFCDGWSVAVIADQVRDGTGGALRLGFAVEPVADGGILVTDDRGECVYDGARGAGECAWRWEPCCTDGVMLGPFGDGCIRLKLSEPSGIDTVVVTNGIDTVERNLDETIEICTTTIPEVR